MNPLDSSTRRTVGIVIVSLLLTLVGLAWWLRPHDDGIPQGMGLSRLLWEEERWRQQDFQKGIALNDTPLWEIQEGLAVRAGITTAGVKGLVRRAVNASDLTYQAEGRLLAGNLDLAAALFEKIASTPTLPPETRAHAWHRRADALWRIGESGVPVALHHALDLLPPHAAESRRIIEADLALWHWGLANFHPENIAAELQGAQAALHRWLALTPPADPAAQTAAQTAARWLLGRVQLRQACLPGTAPAETDPQLLQARETLTTALSIASEESQPTVWAAIHQDLGRAWLETRLRHPDSPDAVVLTAAEHFRQALTQRTGLSAPTAFADVRDLERRASEHLESTAFLALTLALGPDPASAAKFADETLRSVVATDPGPSWLLATLAHALVEKAAHTGLPTAAARSEAAAALKFYPFDQIGQPGVPSRDQVLQILTGLLPPP
ncbi:MAG: hypothetical protein KDK99_21860 [Verrucomicrobiales bacterium]|nr:hypothetical protein [Verrucomicrobiales bacterium]